MLTEFVEPQYRQPPHSSTATTASCIVFVVDDEVSQRASLGRLLESAGWQADTFSSARDFLEYPRPDVPCCVIVDVTLPGLNGLELQQQCAGRQDLPFIFITDCGDIAMTVRAMKAGAVEFLTRPYQDDVLLEAVREALERSRSALRQELELRVLLRRYTSLSLRERQVMALVVSGLLNKQVAGELSISEITVKAHRGQVMRKMEAGSLADLVRIAARLGVN